MKNASSAVNSVVACILVAGCASVSVNKVDRVTGKVVEGAAEGLRFYLPRPYISVYEPFIVASEVFLARGEMSPDSNFVLLTQVPKGLSDVVNADLLNGTQSMGNLRIDASQVRVAPAAAGTPQSVSAAASAAPAAASAAAPASAASAGAADAPPKTDVKNGVLNYKSTNDNNAYAVTPQPRYFNILWLPDFDEQYVVTAKAGLGNAGVVMGFGQGWSLQGLDATVDNSATAKIGLDFLTGTAGALQKVITAKIEGPLAALTGGGPQSASARSFTGGTPVTVKVTKVRVVAPGLYPLLKPKEIEALDLKNVPNDRILVPKPPLTNIAFNTYDVVVIEAARTTGDSALRIQQYVDSTPSAGTKPAAETTDTTVQPTDDALTALRDELSKPENKTKNKEYFVPKFAQAAGVLKVTLQKTTGGTPGTLDALLGDAALKTLVVTVSKAHGVVVDPKNIVVSP